MNQALMTLRLVAVSFKTAFKNPGLFLYLTGYFVLNFLIVQPYMNAPERTPLIRSSINILISLLLFVVFITLLLLIIKHAHARITTTPLDVKTHVQQLIHMLPAIVIYLVICGIYLIVTGTFAFFIAYQATIPAGISFTQLLSQLSAAGQMPSALSQPLINFIIVISLLVSLLLVLWQSITFFVLPIMAIEKQSLIALAKRSLILLKTTKLQVIIGILTFVALIYVGDYIMSFIRIRMLNALLFYALITIFMVFSTLLYLQAKKQGTINPDMHR